MSYQGHPEFYKIVEELKDLHSKKTIQYGNESNPLGNFERASKICEKLLNPNIKNKKLAYLLVLVAKQLDCIYDIIGERKTDTVEEVEDKFKDIAIYSIIGMILERENNHDKEKC